MKPNNAYNQEEIDRINKLKESNNALEEFFTDKRLEWKERLEEIFENVNHQYFNANDFKKVIDSQSMALSYRQVANEEIAMFLNKRSKSEATLKKLTQDKFIFYSTGFGLKTNLGEKKMLIEAHIAENDRNMQLIEAHIDFLRETVKTLESYQYSIRNIISLMDFLGQ